MAEVSYLDNNKLLGESYFLRNYIRVRQEVLNKSGDSIKYIEKNGERYGYEISTNRPLTQLYGFPCYVVKFLFSKIETLHDTQQESILQELCTMLHHDVSSKRGYYNFRVPAHIVDLIKTMNCNFVDTIYCGGTVEEIHVGETCEPVIKDGLELFFADEAFIINNKALLMDMAFRSFSSYQGQYHISSVTESLAGDIYSNWIASWFDSFKPDTVLIAEYEGEVVGYCTIDENDIAVDAVLSSVNEEKRRLGAYKAMIATLIQYAKSKNKLFISSTQFDNYIVQGTWNSLGLRPFYSIYNFHYDNR